MKKTMLFLFCVLLFSGCIGFVDNTGTDREVTTFIVPQKEVEEIVDQGQAKNEGQISEIIKIERQPKN